jgi:hypothetical protein
MFRFTIRELVLVTLVAAMGVAWWLDRTRLVVSFAEVEQLKADNQLLKAKASLVAERMKFFEEMKSFRTTVDRNIQEAGRRLGPDGLRAVPGDKDYQFPPN